MTPITLSPELLIALAGFVTAVVSIATQGRAGLVQARIDEIGLLHSEIERLQNKCVALDTALLKERQDRNAEIDKERRNRMRLQDYIATLRAILIASKIEVPEIPKLE
jgi:hypothetical protein